MFPGSSLEQSVSKMFLPMAFTDLRDSPRNVVKMSLPMAFTDLRDFAIVFQFMPNNEPKD